MHTTRIVLTAAALMTALAAAGGALAKGKPGGGGGDDGGGGTTPDPAIAFIDYNQNDTLLFMDADGGNQTTLVSDIHSAGQTCCWSPDRSRIYFEGYIGGQGIFVYDVATGAVDTIFTGNGYTVSCSPALDPDGNHLVAFRSGPPPGGTGTDIWLYDSVTGSTRSLTAGLQGEAYGRTESYAAFSPDGNRIAWRWNEFRQIQTPDGPTLEATSAGLEAYSFTYDAVTGVVTLGTREEIVRVDAKPGVDPNHVGFLWLDWSRTAGSEVLAYSDYIESEQQYDLFKIDLATAVVTQLTATLLADERSPSWSPDDARIAFARNGQGKESKNSGIYTMTPTGGGLTFVGAKTGAGPDWAR